MYNTVLLNIGTMLYSRSLELIHLVKLRLCSHWLATRLLLLPPFRGNHYSTVCFCEFHCFRRLTCVEWCSYLSFCNWLTSLSMTSSRFIYVVIRAGFLLFYGWTAFHCLCIPHFLYPLIHWWTLSLYPHLSYCKQCCSEHGSANIAWRSWFQ